MKKKILALLIIGLMVFPGCKEEKSTFKREEKAPAVLTDANWKYVGGCEYHISFDEDGSFSAGCSCGDPDMDSDIYEMYRYNEKKGEITTYNEDETGNTYKIIECDEYMLIIEEKDGNRITFYNMKKADSILKAGDWYRETDGGEEHIVFGDDGEFSYTGANGELLWSSDVYNTYKYYESGFFTTYDDKENRGKSADICRYTKDEISLIGEEDEPIVFVNRK